MAPARQSGSKSLGSAQPRQRPAPSRTGWPSPGCADSDVYRFTAGPPRTRVLSSTFPDAETRFSPDGRRLAFFSLRGGDTLEVWLAAADGSGAQQLTHGPGYYQGSPSWSPDGRRIAFDSFGEDWHSHVWVIDADGGTPRRLTSASGDQIVPTWSRDGAGSTSPPSRDRTRRLARPDQRGPAERMTRGGSGKFACESPDGKNLLFQPRMPTPRCWRCRLPEATPASWWRASSQSAFGVAPHGVYYVACDSTPIRWFMCWTLRPGGTDSWGDSRSLKRPIAWASRFRRTERRSSIRGA